MKRPSKSRTFKRPHFLKGEIIFNRFQLQGSVELIVKPLQIAVVQPAH